MSGNNGDQKEYRVRNLEVTDGQGNKAVFPCVTCICGNTKLTLMEHNILCPECDFSVNFEGGFIKVAMINSICKGAFEGTIPIQKRKNP